MPRPRPSNAHPFRCDDFPFRATLDSRRRSSLHPGFSPSEVILNPIRPLQSGAANGCSSIKMAEIDEWWSRIKAATENGLLGCSAKVATMRENPNAVSRDTKVICVYTYDMELDGTRTAFAFDRHCVTSA